MTDETFPTIDATALPTAMAADRVVLDVREDHEWAAGHIDGAVHIPLGALQSRVGELDPSVPTYVVCHLGGRSARAAEWLHAQGHDVTNVAGGMEAWEQAGHPVVS